MKKILLFVGMLFVTVGLRAQLWSSQTTNFAGSSIGVDQVSIVDSNIVWINGFLGDGSGSHVRAHSRTNDGGTTWTAGSYSGMTGIIYPQVLAGVDYNKAFCVAYDSAAQSPTFWQTTDGGSTWTTVTGVLNGGTTFADGVAFWNSSKGFCYGDPVNSKFDIYNTTDGGTTWNSVPTGNISAPLSGEYGFNGADCVCKVPGGIGMFMTNKGRVYKTTDYGVTWAVTPTAPFTVAYSNKIYASSANYMIVAATATSTSTTYDWKYTTDGGTTWNTFTPTSGNFYTFGMCYVPGSPNMFVATSPDYNTIMGVAYSINGGMDWTDYTDILLQPSGANIQCLAVGFASGTTGWVGNYTTGSNTILKYYNPNFDVNVPAMQTISGNDVSIYPNPVRNIVNLKINGTNKADYTIKLIDVTGKVIFEKEMNVNGIASTTFDCSDIVKGLYIVNITTQNSSTNKKLMIN